MTRRIPDLTKQERMATAALANSPRITPRRLAEEANMTEQQAAAWLNQRVA